MTINDSATSRKRLSPSIQPLVWIQLLSSDFKICFFFFLTYRAYLSESMMAISKQFVLETKLRKNEKHHLSFALIRARQ